MEFLTNTLDDIEIRPINENAVLPKVMPYDWDIEIGREPYYVARFNGYVHSIGGKMGVNDYYCWPRDEEPSVDNLVEYDLDEPVAWDIHTETVSRVRRETYGDLDAHSRRTIHILRNGKKFYSFVYNDLYLGLAKAATLLEEIRAHPIDFCSIYYVNNLIGRKIWYRGEKGIIEDWVSGNAGIIISPEEGSTFHAPAEYTGWSKQMWEDSMEEIGGIKTDIFDTHIYWWRD